MNVEIECKIPLENPAETERMLREIGCVDQGEVYEKNWIFDKNQELKNSASLLRLRLTDEHEWGIVTHKSPLQDKQFKCRREIETRVEDAANFRLIIESLGYCRDWYYEKKRHTYHFDRNVNIVLDTTPELGTYIEIEAKEEKTIENLLTRLQLDITDNLLISYREIWRQHCQETNTPFCDWRF